MTRYRLKLTIHDDDTGKAVVEEAKAENQPMCWFQTIMMFNSAFTRLKGSDAKTP